jgi:hypothetical protein
MSDEETTTVEETAADTSTQETGTQQEQQNQQETDWQKRYDDLHPAFTRASQEAAQLRQWQEQVRNDPVAQRQFLQELGYDVQDPEPDPSLNDDPVASLQARLDAMEAAQQTAAQQQAEQQQMAEAMQAGEAHIAKEFEAIARTDLEDAEQAWIISRALSLPPDGNGMPDVKTAYGEFTALEERIAKRRPVRPNPTHRVSPNGAAGESVPDKATHDGRVEHMLSQLQDAAG